jgi:hypothetical protein
MSSNHVYIPETVLRALRETAELGGGLEVSEVIGAAVWAFSRQEEGLQDCLIRDYWSRGPGGAARAGARKTIKEKLDDLVRRIGAPFRKPAPR